MRTPHSLRGDKGRLRDFGEDAKRQGQPEGQDLVLICRPSNGNRRNGLMAGGSIHESTHPSGRSLQTNLGDGRTRKCVSASIS